MQKLINLTHGQEKNILEPLLTGIFLIPPLEYVSTCSLWNKILSFFKESVHWLHSIKLEFFVSSHCANGALTVRSSANVSHWRKKKIVAQIYTEQKDERTKKLEKNL